ncbi:MAG: hypothetical protein ABI365_00005, partial [Lysobacteraceae bacterium]
MNSWQDIALFAAFWGFGVVGLFGITLLPMRSFQLLHRHSRPLCGSAIGKTCLLLLVIAAMVAITAAVDCTYS